MGKFFGKQLFRGLAVFIAATLVFGNVITYVVAESGGQTTPDSGTGYATPAVTGAGGEEAATIASFAPLPDETLWQGFDAGALADESGITLPAELTAFYGDGTSAPVAVTWACEQAGTMAGEAFEDALFNPNREGRYIFAAELPSGYALAAGAALPEITVFIRPAGGVPFMPLSTTEGAFTVTSAAGDNVGYSYDGPSTTLSITADGTYTITGTGTETTDKIKVVSTVTNAIITIENVNINVSGTDDACAFELEAGAIVTLKLVGTNTLKSGDNKAGLQVPENAALTITAANTTSHSLTATGGAGAGSGAGIGGGGTGVAGTITISGCKIIANGGTGSYGGGAGIGGGGGGAGSQGRPAGNIIISDNADVVATGGNGASSHGNGTGIGSGGGTSSLSGGTVIIRDSRVTAQGGTGQTSCGMGIGSGTAISIINSSVEATAGATSNAAGIGHYATVTIEDSIVEATGSNGGAGIGGVGNSSLASGGNVTITNSVVTATGYNGGAGIGGGASTIGGAGGTVTINSGTVTAISGGNGGGAGIGGGASGNGNGGAGGTVTINGGTVTATGGSNIFGGGGAGIGGGCCSMGGSYSGGAAGTVEITGGSVKIENGSSKAGEESKAGQPAAPTNGTNPVYLATLTLEGASAGTAVDETASTISGYSYGLKDVKTTSGGELYFYLPDNTYDITLITSDKAYINPAVTVDTTNTTTATLAATALPAPPAPPAPPSGGGSTGSGNNSGGGGSTYDPPAPPKQIGEDDAKKLAASEETRENGYAQTSYSGECSASKAFFKALGGTSYRHDTLDGNSIQVRISIPDPTKATKKIALSGYVKGVMVDRTRMLFEQWRANQLRVISLDQQGDFGMEVQIAAKVDFTGMKTDNLYFYSYDKDTNTYKQFETKYRIDKSGYLHFTTFLAGDIVVSDGPLVRRDIDAATQNKQMPAVYVQAIREITAAPAEQSGNIAAQTPQSEPATEPAQLEQEAVTVTPASFGLDASGIGISANAKPAETGIAAPADEGITRKFIVPLILSLALITASILLIAVPRIMRSSAAGRGRRK